jgi:hypothetical protein
MNRFWMEDLNRSEFLMVMRGIVWDRMRGYRGRP